MAARHTSFPEYTQEVRRDLRRLKAESQLTAAEEMEARRAWNAGHTAFATAMAIRGARRGVRAHSHADARKRMAWHSAIRHQEGAAGWKSIGGRYSYSIRDNRDGTCTLFREGVR